jgi:hypothetical protein
MSSSGPERYLNPRHIVSELPEYIIIRTPVFWCAVTIGFTLKSKNPTAYMRYILSRNKAGKVKTKTRVHVGANSEFLNVHRVLQAPQALMFGITTVWIRYYITVP